MCAVCACRVASRRVVRAPHGNSEPLIAAGGNWWDKQHTQKATASNAGPVILSLMLHSHFPTDRSYSAFAEKVYHY